MTPGASLTLPAELHGRLRVHLFPGDGLEAAAVVLCTRAPGARLRLLAVEAILVPYAACKERAADFLTWPGALIEGAIDKAEENGLSILLMHSHPGGLFDFSSMDDASDQAVVPSLHAAIEQLHGTAVMLQCGAVRARTYDQAMVRSDIEHVTVPGQDVQRWWSNQKPDYKPMAFTQAMRAELGRLSALVIGVSGTGSMVAEQLARLGFGKVVLVDHDHVEDRNLNRILNTTIEDAQVKAPKVSVFDRAITSYRGEGVAQPVYSSIIERDAVVAAAQCDVMFSCVDRLDARYFADQIAASFLMPLFDVGVSIPTRRVDGAVSIAEVCTRLDYVRPGGPTLGDRQVYTPASLRAEELRGADPVAFQKELEDGYIKGLAESAPDVISLNMRASSDCMLEFLARYYGFRHEGNAGHVRTISLLSSCEVDIYSEDVFQRDVNPNLGRGDREPLLGMPRFRVQKASER